MKEIIINTSNVPILRAGFGNLIIPLALISIILLAKILTELDTPVFLKIILPIFVFLFWIKVYFSNISKILIELDKIEFTTPLFKRIIHKKDIQSIKIHTIPSSLTIVISIKFFNKTIPMYFTFVCVNTSIGSYEDTLSVLKTELKKGDRGIKE